MILKLTCRLNVFPGRRLEGVRVCHWLSKQGKTKHQFWRWDECKHKYVVFTDCRLTPSWGLWVLHTAWRSQTAGLRRWRITATTCRPTSLTSSKLELWVKLPSSKMAVQTDNCFHCCVWQKLADRLYGIHKLHANYGRVFKEWSSIERDMAAGLQSAGQFMDVWVMLSTLSHITSISLPPSLVSPATLAVFKVIWRTRNSLQTSWRNITLLGTPCGMYKKLWLCWFVVEL